YEYGGGIFCNQGSCPTIKNVIVTSNFSEGWGGGISCRNGSDACIKSTKIYNNHADYGGGVSCYNASPYISDVLISNNSSEFFGGGFYCKEYSSPTFTDVEISNNIAYLCGGGIALYQNSSPTFNDVRINNNCCEDDESIGGGLYVTRSSASLLGATINQNTATHGGAIYCALNAIVEINNSYFFENISYCNAGCILCDDSDIFMKSCTINNSDAFSYGGAMYVLNDSYVRMDSVSLISNVSSVGGGINIDNSNLDIYSSYLYNNSACDGGAIISFNSELNIFNSLFVENGTYEGGSAIDARNSSDVFCCNVTMTDNYAETSCGGIRCDSNSNVEMYNSILWNDTQPEIIGSNVSVMYSNIQGGWAGSGNINADPLFADTLNEDYHLTQDSPCVDAGTPDTTGLHLPPWDLDGNIRVWDGNGNGVAIIDMGVYEYGSPSCSIHKPELPEESIIYNFPNPTKNSTTILYLLKKSSHVRISIYNIKGQLVNTLVETTKPKGEYSVFYNTKELNSGVYFYKIQTDDMSEIRKMIVIK
ncbi:MAG: T9SS type A sorting domain-containing protein, partial [Candidatus Celaenobacter polaris]|nr:T9SS type A sorting domain-containing protein [Candidatus Celaenobacter polaris]